ncbi:Nif3-like dinuclear metal center hexameric protein [Neptunomonas marina]|uniref:GTP cyclohydrolase 1 type 2 homolog n=1 Tax=Neptunomonas marina TaxID=1815562 RepID=A0A437Q824_9GAMM|nr:Nif3-like dinuclear metal center hexameric protein [Neptunomonas marina]RVU30657.1 Nif3-like dinuclear metal center hexameric protein [Neptunomonas marina]
MALPLRELVNYCDGLLNTHLFKDYCPNGLQVEGKPEVQRIVSGVTACQALLDQAVELEADLVLVHHGYFWKGEDQTVTGIKKRRVNTLLQHEMSLLAYHLPLDAHPEVGNNAQLARQLGLVVESGLDGELGRAIGMVGYLPESMSGAEFSQKIASALGREPLHIAGIDREIKRVAWCTGGAQSYIEKAFAAGVDAYISGEISEPTVHFSREAGIDYFAAGHHATERYGAKALGELLAEKFNLEHTFVDIDNPV